MEKELQTTKEEILDQAAEELAMLFVMMIDAKTTRKNKRSKLLEKSNDLNNEETNNKEK